MTELEQALLKALEKQDEELECVHKRIEHQQQQINHLAGLVERTIDFGRRTVERLAASVREIGKTITRERSQSRSRGITR